MSWTETGLYFGLTTAVVCLDYSCSIGGHLKTQPRLGDQESLILKHISGNPSVSVREVSEHFEKTLGLARTTILTVMERLRKKGYLARKQVDGIYRYYPKVEGATILKNQISDFVQRTLGGSISPLIHHFVGKEKLSEEEITQLKELIRRSEGKDF